MPERRPPEPERWRLTPRRARVLYNVADAWRPERAGADAVAALDAVLASPRARRRIERTLAWIEWSPRLALASARGFSWLPRAERRAWLERLAGRAPAFVCDRVRALLDALDQSPPPGA
jgi:hypothetical protein